MERRFEGTTVPDPGFAGDEGAADPALVEALAAYAGAPDDSATYAAALTALASSRLLVPVVAVLGEAEVDEEGLTHDKSSDMAAVLLPAATVARPCWPSRAWMPCLAGAPTRARCPSPPATPRGQPWRTVRTR